MGSRMNHERFQDHVGWSMEVRLIASTIYDNKLLVTVRGGEDERKR
jgi:hypothetical protein